MMRMRSKINVFLKVHYFWFQNLCRRNLLKENF